MLLTEAKLLFCTTATRAFRFHREYTYMYCAREFRAAFYICRSGYNTLKA